MKKFMVTVMVLVVVLSMMSTAFAERTRLELTFADDFEYKDDQRLSTYGYNYDDGSFEGYVDIADIATIIVFGNEEMTDCGFRVIEHHEDGDRTVLTVGGCTVDELNNQYLDEATNYVGLYLSKIDEGWA